MIIRHATLHESTAVWDIAVRDGVITAIEPSGSITATPDEEVIDVDRRVVIPGLWDEHVHMGQWAARLRRVDVRQASSAAEALQLMAQGASARPADSIIVGAGMRPGTWSDQPHLDIIDEASGDVPWVIFSIDIHSCWVNTAAMKRFGVNGSDDGVLTEHDSFALLGLVDAVSPEISDDWVRDAENMAARRGVVGIVDLDMGPTLDNWVRRRRGEENTFVLRVDAAVYPDTLDEALSRGLRSGDDLAPGVRMGPLKAITDGSLNTRTAFVSEPYVGSGSDECGTLNYTVEHIDEFVGRAHQAGIDVTLHAIGDRANTLMLDVFDRHGIPGRIEHAQLVAPADIPRFAELGVTASVQPQHAVDDREVTDRFWPDRVDQAFPLKSLLGSGARVVFCSDAPVSALDPWDQIASAVTRTDDELAPWRPEETISVGEALKCSQRSTIALGQPADLAVLEADPLWLAEALHHRPTELSRALRSIEVALTVVAGRVTHRALGEER
jgi:predicted amidohydrolase YtcJ